MYMNMKRNIVGMVLLSGCLAGAVVAAERDDSASERLGFKLSLQCYTFNYLTFYETVDKAAALGIKYLELFPGQKIRAGSEKKIEDTITDVVACEEVMKKVSDAGLKMVAYGVCWAPTKEPLASTMMEWAKKLGVEVLVVNTHPNALLDKLSANYKIRIALHNHPKSWPPEEVLKACAGLNPLIGSCSDTGHWMRDTLVPIDSLRQLKGRVEHLHLKDLNDFGKGHDVVWGTGKADIKAILAELKRQEFKGYLSIEYERGRDYNTTDLPLCVAYFDKIATELAKQSP